MTDKINLIYAGVINGDSDSVRAGLESALAEGTSPEKLLNEGLIAAMTKVGRLFEEGEYYVPEMLISARAMQAGMGILRPILVAQDFKTKGCVVIGTVQGDMHDIGKNLVSMMLEGAGFQVIDLGADCSPQKFLSAIQEHRPQIVGMSAMLTTTMFNMKKTIQFLEENLVRQDVKVIIGGAPVTQKFADDIGADGFAGDANQAAILAGRLLQV